MGTRSLTIMMGDYDDEVGVMYRQFDGYAEGHGQELANFLSAKTVVNGIPVGQDSSLMFNGFSCLSAQLISHFKEGAGGFYLYPAGTRNAGEEYIYIVMPDHNKQIRMICYDVYENIVFYDGSPDGYTYRIKDDVGLVGVNPDQETSRILNRTKDTYSYGSYYSESKRESLPIGEMNPKHIRNALLKSYKAWAKGVENMSEDELVKAVLFGHRNDLINELLRAYVNKRGDD